MTPTEAAQTILATIPRAVPPATLEEYGLAASPPQARQITREMLALSLFWVRSACEVAFKAATGERVFEELRRAIVGDWETGFGQQDEDVQRFFEVAEARRRGYDRVMREGASPVLIATEAAAALTEAGGVPPEDRAKALALLLDLVPVDEIGETISELDVSAGNQR